MTAKAIESARIAQKMIKQTAENVVSFAYEVIREQANITKLVSVSISISSINFPTQRDKSYAVARRIKGRNS